MHVQDDLLLIRGQLRRLTETTCFESALQAHTRYVICLIGHQPLRSGAMANSDPLPSAITLPTSSEAGPIALPAPEKVSEWVGATAGPAPLPSPLQDLAAAA